MSLHIITRKPNNYFSSEYLKLIARKILNKKRGPQAVVASLLRGLSELEVNYKINTVISKTDILYVNESLDALRWAIKLKKSGLIEKLIAGPNLVVCPDDNDKIIQSEEIDIYLMPSQWTLDFYASYGNKVFNDKMRIWAAGVILPKESAVKRDTILVYKKNISDDIFKLVTNELEKKGLKYAVLYYGGHKRAEYIHLLERCQGIIYLQTVESQGIALLEAWAQNVPSLVYDEGKYVFTQLGKTVYGKVSAPYLTDKCGIFFQQNNFSESLKLFLEKLPHFKPQEFIANNFTDKICAENFLKIIK